jgi:hypothetical protein
MVESADIKNNNWDVTLNYENLCENFLLVDNYLSSERFQEK